MYAIVIGLLILFAVLLVLVVLAQNSKGGGLTSQFGGSAASNIIGVKKTGDLLEKLTWTFIIGIMIGCLATNMLTPTRQNSTNGIFERAGEQAPTPAPSLNLPADGTDNTTPAPADSTGK